VVPDPRLFLLLASLAAQRPPAAAQAPMAWDGRIGFSYLATGGNSQTSSTGFDAAFNRTGPVWSAEGSAAGVSASKRRRRTAESYNAQARLKRRLHKRLQLTVGLRWERNRFAGLDSRRTADVSLLWEIRETPTWKLRALGGLSYGLEEPWRDGPAKESSGGLLQVSGDSKLSPTASWDGQLTFFPNFQEPRDYRLNGHVGLQAALSRRLALRLGYDLKYDHLPVPGFGRTDTSTTAALVLQLGGK